MAPLVCGIDLGSTNVKVVLADERGRAVHTNAVQTPRVFDGIGSATNATALVTLLEVMVVEGWRAAGGGAPLAAIAVAGVGEDGVAVDADLRPTGLALPWFDMRAKAEGVELRQHRAATPLAGIAISADRTVAKWLWLRRNRPDALAGAKYWIALTDYPTAWWSGTPFMSQTLAPRTGCYDVYARQWIEPLLEAAGAPPLPNLCNAGVTVGTVRPGPLTASGAASAQTLLVAGGHDHPIAASAIRSVAVDARIDSMGTANLVYGETSRLAIPVFDPFMGFSVPPSGAPGLACLGVTELDAALALARSDEVLFRRLLAAPRLPGSPGPTIGADGRNPETVVRRALEHTSFHARRMFAAIDAAGAPPGPIFSTGGRARSQAFVELRASVFGQPIHVIDEPELTAIGAAFLALQAAAGVSPQLTATRQVGIIDPVPAWAETYNALYPGICRALEAAAARKAA